MVSSPLELIDITQALADALQTGPAGLCAIASVALWCLWRERSCEELTLCIGFKENVANHVFLRQGAWLLDPTGHQFENHNKHCYVALSEDLRVAHHQTTVETNCMVHFHEILKMVGWPAEQWPTKERVNTLLQSWRAHEKRRLSASCSNNDSA